MEATLNNGQFRPGNETPFMYTAFASEGEMLGFLSQPQSFCKSCNLLCSGNGYGAVG